MKIFLVILLLFVLAAFVGAGAARLLNRVVNSSKIESLER